MDKYKTMRLVLAVTIKVVPGVPDVNDRMAMRVIDAIVPHPDSALATSRAGEMVTVLLTDWEVTS